MTAHESEWKTRKQRIDKRLRSLDPAWVIISYQDGLDLSGLQCHAVEEFPTANGPADYALFVGGKLLGIVEAKKVTVNPQNVLEQAKRYAAGAFQGPGNWDGLRVPFLYATNGELIWHLDVRGSKPVSRQIGNFPYRLRVGSTFCLRPEACLQVVAQRLPGPDSAHARLPETLHRGGRAGLGGWETGTAGGYEAVAEIGMET